MSELEALLALQIRATGLPEPQREFMFAKSIGRKWRADFAWTEPVMLLAEVEGGQWTGGRHVTGRGFTEDCRKYDAAVELGYQVVRFTAELIHDGTAIRVLQTVLRRALSVAPVAGAEGVRK